MGFQLILITDIEIYTVRNRMFNLQCTEILINKKLQEASESRMYKVQQFSILQYFNVNTVLESFYVNDVILAYG